MPAMCEWVCMVADCMQFLLSVFIWPCTFFVAAANTAAAFILSSADTVNAASSFSSSSSSAFLGDAGCWLLVQMMLPVRSFVAINGRYLSSHFPSYIYTSMLLFLSTFICSSFYSGLGYYRMVFGLALVRFASCVTCLLCASEMCMHIFTFCVHIADVFSIRNQNLEHLLYIVEQKIMIDLCPLSIELLFIFFYTPHIAFVFFQVAKITNKTKKKMKADGKHATQTL